MNIKLILPAVLHSDDMAPSYSGALRIFHTYLQVEAYLHLSDTRRAYSSIGRALPVLFGLGIESRIRVTTTPD